MVVRVPEPRPHGGGGEQALLGAVEIAEVVVGDPEVLEGAMTIGSKGQRLLERTDRVLVLFEKHQ